LSRLLIGSRLSTANAFVADQVARLLPGIIRGAGLSGGDNPTAVFRRDLHQLISVWRQVQGGRADPAELDRATAAFMAIHGGRGQTFVPLVSDDVWDTHPDDLLAVLPALATASPEATTDRGSPSDGKPTGAVARRLSEISAERDWMAYGYEQATRLIRNPVRQGVPGRYATAGRVPRRRW
jgi:hypothetical protein